MTATAVQPYYHDEAHGITVYQGDCRDVLPTLDAVDHVITDPPYEAEAHTMARRQSRGPDTLAESYEIGFDAMTEDLRCFIAHEVKRLSGGWSLLFCQAEAIGIWREVLVAAGARWVRAQAWIKPDGTPQFTGDRPSQSWEAIATAWSGGSRMSWNGGGGRGFYIHNVNNFGRFTNGRPHPTQKPEALMRELIELFTDPGDLVLDAFAGSFTTGVACKELGRRFIGIELEQKWCDVGVKRLKNTEYKPPLFTLAPSEHVQPLLIPPLVTRNET